MKKTLLTFFVIFLVMQFIRVEQSDTAIIKDQEIKAPLEIYSILESSCFDCHSNKAEWPWYSQIAPASWLISSHVNNGRDALNFSIWETYTQEEKQEELKAIYRTVYTVMPLPSYIWLHPEADLTKEQRSLIRKWTGVRK